MTNEEFKLANYKAITDMYKYEGEIVKDVHGIIGYMEIPKATETFETRINELFDLFENDDIPIDQHLITTISATFFLNQYASIIHHLDKYLKTFFEAKERGDDATVKSLLELKPDIESSLAEMNESLLNINLQDDLDTILDSFQNLPGNVSKDVAHRRCMYELHKVKYQSKDGSNSKSK